MLKSISFHPKLAAVLDLCINLAMLAWLQQLSSWRMVWLWLVVRIAVWGIFIWRVYYPKEIKQWKHLLSLVIMTIGALAFLLFIEWNFAWYLFGAFFSFFSFFSFWLLPSSRISLSVFLKPHLRWRFVMSIIGLAGIFQGTQAVVSFQIFPTVSSWIVLLFASLCGAGFASWWWWEYGAVINKRFWVWSSVWFLLFFELIWVVNKLPLGYLASSLILIWCWYAVWLLIRFNLSSEGVNWKKQILFLTINSVLFVSFLTAVVRWK
ncbi:MAG: hypothetical protein KBC69_00340 [Candidatus Magasanikbacteria bacterium]|nr:hypothetical protein [Candidatus Magasanikbacteria bacterium]